MQCGILDGSLEQKEDIREKADEIQIKSVHYEQFTGVQLMFLVEINVMEDVNIKVNWAHCLWKLSYYFYNSCKSKIISK